LLFKELLIGVTSFFRDPAGLGAIAEAGAPALLLKHRPAAALRAWVAGCSTGEEAYSLAIVFKEALEQLNESAGGVSLQIFATDLDPDAIDKARQGVLPRPISPPMSRRNACNGYFIQRRAAATGSARKSARW
jgi:two-component system CheB/CheR fusion protein